MKNSDNNNNETDRFSKSEKPVFLYTVIGVLTVAVIALGAVSFLSLNHLVTLQQKVQTLSNTVQDISTDANTLISQADQLDELREQESSVQTATGETTAAAQSDHQNPLQDQNRKEHFPLLPALHSLTTQTPVWIIF